MARANGIRPCRHRIAVASTARLQLRDLVVPIIVKGRKDAGHAGLYFRSISDSLSVRDWARRSSSSSSWAVRI